MFSSDKVDAEMKPQFLYLFQVIFSTGEGRGGEGERKPSAYVSRFGA